MACSSQVKPSKDMLTQPERLVPCLLSQEMQGKAMCTNERTSWQADLPLILHHSMSRFAANQSYVDISHINNSKYRHLGCPAQHKHAVLLWSKRCKQGYGTSCNLFTDPKEPADPLPHVSYARNLNCQAKEKASTLAFPRPETLHLVTNLAALKKEVY